MATKKFGPQAERLLAVAASRRVVAIGGRRDAEGVTTSSVHTLPTKGKPASMPVDAAVGGICFLADELLLAGTTTGALVAFAASEEPPKELLRTRIHQGAVLALTSDLLGRVFASVDGRELLVGRVEINGASCQLRELGRRALAGQPGAVAIDPLGQLVAVGGEDGIIRSLPLDNVANGPVREMPCGDAPIRALAFTGDGRIAAGSADGGLRLCYLEGDVDVQDRSGDAAHASAIRGLVLGPMLTDEAGRELPRRLYSAGEDGVAKAWFIDGKRRPKTVELGGSALLGVAWVPPALHAKEEHRAGQLAVVTYDRRVYLLPLSRDGELLDPAEEVDSLLARLAQDLAQSGSRAVPGRAAAVKTLADYAEEEARLLLEKALADQAREVRLAAAKALGAASRRQSRPALRRAVNDNDAEVRAAALASLKTLEADTPLAAVKAGLASKHEDVRLVAVADLQALAGRSPVVPGLIADRLTDDAAEVRLRALDALFDIDRDTLEPVRVALARGPEDIRCEALVRLVFSPRMQLAGAQAILQEALDDDHPTVREIAYDLGVLRVPALAARLRQHDKALDKTFAELEKRPEKPSTVGGSTIDDAALTPLFAAFASRQPDSMLRGALGLALLGDGRATGAILQFSREPDAGLRLTAVHALATAALVLVDDERIPARLAWLLDDENASVRAAAFDALAALGGDKPQARATLAEGALRSSHEDIRVRALQLVVKLGGPGASDAEVAKKADQLLGDALDDEAAKVRGEAFRTLWAWHSKEPEIPLRRGQKSRHGDIRGEVVKELARLRGKLSAADSLLLALAADSVSAVALAAYEALTKEDSDKKRAEPHLAAMSSPRPDVRAKAAKGCVRAPAEAMRKRLIELIKDEHPEVHIAAIEAYDRLLPKDKEGFEAAFASIFYNLRVRGGELLGVRRDERAIEPMRALLVIPKTDLNRPSDELRERAARALADVGDKKLIPFFVSMLDDEDGLVREMGARGLATACPPGREQPLVDALGHADLAVRSWAAEGLARLGDPRALPVLAGTQKHEHRPIRVGAILGFVALGPDGVRGLRQALSDPDREVQDLALAIIVARDLALAQAGLAPDILLSTVSAAHPEVRFAGARILEARVGAETIEALASELVGPRKPEKAADMKDWPKEESRAALLRALVQNLASDHPGRRYAAARVLSLRGQAVAFWREAERLAKPGEQVPFTNWADEKVEPRKQGWVRRLLVPRSSKAPETKSSGLERLATVLRFAAPESPQAVPAEEGTVDGASIRKLVFGVYAGLIRQAPPKGEADETHRVRRDALDRVATLAADPVIGRAAGLPVLERALSDPNHIVRLAALTALRELYPQGSLEPLARAVESDAADVGRAAVGELLAAAQAGNNEAAVMLRAGLEAPSPEVRAEVLLRLPRLYPAGALEPWLLALKSRHADVRRAVVDRLADSSDTRVTEALWRAVASEDVDLRLRAAKVLAHRGDPEVADVLAAFLRSEEHIQEAIEALVALAHARPLADTADRAAAAAATALAARLEDDPDHTAPRDDLVKAIERVGHPAAQPPLLRMLFEPDPKEEHAETRQQIFAALMATALKKGERPQRLKDGTERQRYDEPRALTVLTEATRHPDAEIRKLACARLRDVDDKAAEALLARMLADRVPEVRVAAADTLAFRAEYVPGATLDALAAALRGGRRELVLPAALGLAARKRKEAFQALLLVLKAGEGEERERALLALGSLGDKRALEHVQAFLDPALQSEDESDSALAPAAAEALGRLLPALEGDEAREVREKVEQLARSGQGDMRKRAIVGLRHAGDARSRAVIEELLADPHDDDDVRSEAARQLGILRDPASEGALAAALRAGYWVRRQAREALERLFPDDKARVALHLIQSDWNDAVEEAAAYLARHADPAVVAGYLDKIRDADARRRLRLGLVRRQAHPTAPIVALLEGASTAGRAEAAWVAGASEDEALAPAVAKAAQRAALDFEAERQARLAPAGGERDDAKLEQIATSWQAALWAAERVQADVTELTRRAAPAAATPDSVRREALRYLAQKQDPTDAALFEHALSDSDAQVRVTAATALAVIAKDRAGAILEKLTVPDVGSLAPLGAATLDTLGGKALAKEELRRVVLPVAVGQHRVEALVAVATTPGKDPSRLVAIQALGRLGGDTARAGLEKILEDKKEDDVVRAAAFRALRRLQRAEKKRYTGDKGGKGNVPFGAAGGGSEDEDEDSDDGDEDEDSDDGDEDEDSDDGDEDEDSGGDDEDEDSDDGDEDEDSGGDDEDEDSDEDDEDDDEDDGDEDEDDDE